MAVVNLLKASYEGKLGQTVGAKWKSSSTIRTLTAPSNPDTQKQQTVRGGFTAVTQFVARFTDQLKYLSALQTRNMSVRNAIIKLNKDQVAAGALTKADLLISKGGLQKPSGVTATAATTGVTVSWTAPTATNFTADAEAIVVVVVEDKDIAVVAEEKVSEFSKEVAVTLEAGDVADVYVYFIDWRGSNKVGSDSVYATATVA